MTVFYDRAAWSARRRRSTWRSGFPLEGGGLSFDISLPFRPARLAGEPLTVSAGDIGMTWRTSASPTR
jgi:hypothetical protein